MLEAEAHEQAAMLLGAFALREAAGDFHDTRRALSRMTAHLALAEALRGGGEASSDGQYARLVLSTLVGREREVIQELANRRAGSATREETAWLNALTLRNTGDWRIMTTPSRASLLERLEYFRALCRTQGGARALEYLRNSLAKPVPDWGRAALESRFTITGGRSFSVDEGNTFIPAMLALELEEAEQILHAPVSAAAPDDLKQRFQSSPQRCIVRLASGGFAPQVTGHGAWAGFFDRHFCHALQSRETYLRGILGLAEEAQSLRAKMRAEFGPLKLFPLLDVRWENEETIRSPTAFAGDKWLGPCPRAVELVRGTPELVTATNWLTLERLCSKSRADKRIPDSSLWFAQGPPRGTNYDAHRRIAQILSQDPQAVEQALDRAPHDAVLIRWRVGGAVAGERWGRKLTPEQFAASWGPLLGYHSEAEQARATMLVEGDEALRKSKTELCQSDPDTCSALGVWLFVRGFQDEGAAALERALKNARDRVAISHDMDWLVDHHFDRGNSTRAMEVADDVAAVYSASGLRTKARLLNRMRRFEEAEAWYKELADQYPDAAENLWFFYIRYEQRQSDARFRYQAAIARKRVFPAGLQRVALADLKRPPLPTEGFSFFGGVDELLQPLGLRPDDVVVALDAYRIRTPPQWTCVKGFTDDPAISVIVWRFGKYLELKGNIRRTYFGPPHGPGPLVKSSPR